MKTSKIIILIIAVIVTYLILTKINIEGVTSKTTNAEVYRVPLDVYVIKTNNTEISYGTDEVNSMLSGVNKIWIRYGVVFYLNEFHEDVYAPENLAVVGTISGNPNNDAEALGNYTLLQFPRKFNDGIIDVFLIQRFNSSIEGVGLNRGDNIGAAFVSDSKKITWDLAHEFGHVMNLEHQGLFNLMVDSLKSYIILFDGFLYKASSPTYLSGQQLDAIRNIIETKYNHTVIGNLEEKRNGIDYLFFKIKKFFSGYPNDKWVSLFVMILWIVILLFLSMSLGDRLGKWLVKYRVRKQPESFN